MSESARISRWKVSDGDTGIEFVMADETGVEQTIWFAQSDIMGVIEACSKAANIITQRRTGDTPFLQVSSGAVLKHDGDIGVSMSFGTYGQLFFALTEPLADHFQRALAQALTTPANENGPSRTH